PDRRPLADVLTCIREKTTIDRAGRKLAANGERYLKTPQEITRLFREARQRSSTALDGVGNLSCANCCRILALGFVPLAFLTTIRGCAAEESMVCPFAALWLT